MNNHICPACNCAGLSRGGLNLVEKNAYLAESLRISKQEALKLKQVLKGVGNFIEASANLLESLRGSTGFTENAHEAFNDVEENLAKLYEAEWGENG